MTLGMQLFYQLLEGKVPMIQSIMDGFTDLGAEFVKGRILAQIGLERDGVDKITHQIFIAGS